MPHSALFAAVTLTASVIIGPLYGDCGDQGVSRPDIFNISSTRKYTDIQLVGGNTLYLLDSGGAVRKSTNFGVDWRVISYSQEDQYFNKIHFLDGSGTDSSIGFMSGNSERGGIVQRTVDGGMTWTPVFNADNHRIGCDTYAYQIFDLKLLDDSTIVVSIGETFVFYGTIPFYRTNFYKSTNLGDNWNFIGTTPGFLHITNHVSSGSLFAAGSSASVAGQPFAPSVYKISDSSKVVKLFPINEDITGLLGVSAFGMIDVNLGIWADYAGSMMRTVDGGESWSRINIDSTSTLGSIVFIDKVFGIAAGNDGTIIRTLDGGVTWDPITTNITDHIRKLIFIDDTTLIALSDTSLWQVSFGGEIQLVSDNTLAVSDRRSAIPNAITLHPAFPNPFNPYTTLTFNLPHAAQVSLIVYDIQGREVAQILSGVWMTGGHTVKWNARDERGKQVPSGIYIVQLRTPKLSKSIRIVYLK